MVWLVRNKINVQIPEVMKNLEEKESAEVSISSGCNWT